LRRQLLVAGFYTAHALPFIVA
jgi:integration host factor subunit beta